MVYPIGERFGFYDRDSSSIVKLTISYGVPSFLALLIA